MNSSEQDRALLGRMLGPDGEEVGCDECFELLDVYVELAAAGDDVATALPRVHAHVQGCPVCRDEVESLRSLLQRDDAEGIN